MIRVNITFMKTISFIIPAYNEAGNVAELHSQITEVIEEINNYEFEFLFIENGSTDETLMNCKNCLK